MAGLVGTATCVAGRTIDRLFGLCAVRARACFRS